MALTKGLGGITAVLNNLRKHCEEIEKKATSELMKTGAAIRRDGQKQTPVDTGNLVNSWYGPTPFKGPNGPVVEIGLTASYAPFVHENLEAKFKKPGAKAKFLEDPLKEHAKDLLTNLSNVKDFTK